jgi:hypothetical protein
LKAPEGPNDWILTWEDRLARGSEGRQEKKIQPEGDAALLDDFVALDVGRCLSGLIDPILQQW